MLSFYDFAVARHHELVREAELDAELRRRPSQLVPSRRARWFRRRAHRPDTKTRRSRRRERRGAATTLSTTTVPTTTTVTPAQEH